MTWREDVRGKFLAAVLLVLVCAGSCPGAEVEATWEVEGAGVLVKWKVSDSLLPRLGGFLVLESNRPSQTLPAGDRELFLPWWLGEGEEKEFRFLVRLLGGGYTQGAALKIKGPFRQTNLTVTGEVKDIGETSYCVAVQVKGGPGEVRIFEGRRLMATVKPPQTQAVISGLSPGTRYEPALVPYITKDGEELRGERTTLAPFTTRLTTSWALVNKGGRLNGDEPVTEGYRWSMQAMYDRAGNLLFTIPSKELGSGMGRFHLKKRIWELRGMAGWTQDRSVPVRPIFDGLFRIKTMQGFHDPKGGLHAIVACSTSSGKRVLDIHGSLHHFQWTQDQWEQYSGGKVYSRYVSRPLFNTWTGSGAGWGFGINKKGRGLAVHVKKSLSSKGRLIFVRLDFRDPANLWSVWHDGKWKPHSYLYSHLPDPAPPRELEDTQPRVVSIDGKNLWLVVFQRTLEYRKTQPFWTAMLYDDRAGKWLRWTAKKWKPEGDLVELSCGSFDKRTLRLFRERSGKVVFLWQKDGKLMRAEYRSRRWTGPVEIARIHSYSRYNPSYAAKVSPSGKIMVAYSTDGHSISIDDKGKVFAGKDALRIGDLAFVGRTPVVFFGRKGELLAVAGKPLSEGTVAGSLPALIEKTPDPEVVQYLGSFVNYATDPKIPEGSKYPIRPSYGPQHSGHMACTAEGLLIAPRFAVCNVCLFPPDHPKGPAVFWGGFWDYFMFPMGTAVDARRGKIYISHRVTNGGCGGLLGGVVAIWDLAEADKCHWSKPGLRGKSKPRAITPGHIKDSFRWPSGMAVDGERGFLYVANSLTNDVRKFNVAGHEPKRVGIVGEGELDFPRGVACDPQGNVYVVDSRHHRVCVFDPGGKLLRTLGSMGRGPGEFLYPWGIALDPRSKLVFVSDPQNGRVQVFDDKGAFVTWWNRFPAASLDGAKPQSRGSRALPGNHDDTFGLACDGRGFLYVGTGSHIAKFRIVRSK